MGPSSDTEAASVYGETGDVRLAVPMTETKPDELRQAVEHTHGGAARLVQIVPVHGDL